MPHLLKPKHLKLKIQIIYDQESQLSLLNIRAIKEKLSEED